MNIPDKAIEALIDSLGWRIVDGRNGAAKEALEAAAPYLCAQALRGAANAVRPNIPPEMFDGSALYDLDTANWLDARADELEAGR